MCCIVLCMYRCVCTGVCCVWRIASPHVNVACVVLSVCRGVCRLLGATASPKSLSCPGVLVLASESRLQCSVGAAGRAGVDEHLAWEG